jgi:energy-coupling factor transporter ATP-binding protein EcfA2
MILVQGLELHNYKAIKHAKLLGMRDLNVFIGPNNCGKTSILAALKLLAELRPDYGWYECQTCGQLESQTRIKAVGCTVPYSDKYLRQDTENTEICFSFNEEEINKLVPRALARVRNAVSAAPPGHCVDELRMKGKTTLVTEHVSPFGSPDIIELLNRLVLFCPEQRLQTYHEKAIQDYIRDKNFLGASLRRWEDLLRSLVDPKVTDHAFNLDLIKNIEGSNFQTSLGEQGSGVRSLACLLADLISAENARIVLIDEPELGLNPFSKQELLKFLLEESKTRQMFLATHDPTLVNPILWKSRSIVVFSFSPYTGEFVKINLEESKEAPETFAGYLPHTVSLRNIHMYVEGTSDVYVLQVFLRKYCTQKYENWSEMLNKVGTFHLGGDFWCHLLHSVPKPPYRCVIILDGDKKQNAKEVCQKYDEAVENVPRFELAENIEDLGKIMAKHDRHPIYCLKRNCIEEYLEPKPSYDKPDYHKVIEGPGIAENMEQVPDEIRGLFEAVLKET